MKKKIFLFFLIFSTMTNVFAAKKSIDAEIDGIYYRLYESKTASVISRLSSSGVEYSGSVIIPSSVKHEDITYTVTSIGYQAFAEDAGLTYVSIPNSVTSFDLEAFEGCSGLTSIDIPGNVKTIGILAFRNCSNLKSVTIGNGVEIIGGAAFYGCTSLTSITIPSSVTSIESDAFSQCSKLESVNIANGVESIGAQAFYGDSSLTSITIPESVKSVEYDAFSDCTGLRSVLWNAKSCKLLGAENHRECTIFGGDSITSFTFGESVDTIPNVICKNLVLLTSMALPQNIKGIRDDAFSGCTGLTSITIPVNVAYIGDDVFKGCKNLTAVTWNAKKCIDVASYERGAIFYDIAKNITSFTIGEGVELLPKMLCYNMKKLTSIAIPSSVNTIEEQAFYGCEGLTSVHTSDLAAWCNIDFYAKDANPLCYAHHLYHNGNVIKDLVVPEGLDSIRRYAFYQCYDLTSASIPNSVTSIGAYAFKNCSSLSSANIPNGVTRIGEYAFSGCEVLESVNIPNGVKNIGKYAFSSCRKFTSLEIPNSITRIEDGAFSSLWNLTSLKMGENVESIGKYAFSSCSKVNSITIPKSVKRIDDMAFYLCENLIVHITDLAAWCDIDFETNTANPMSVSRSLHYFYLGEEEIINLVIPDGVTEIKKYAFSRSAGLNIETLVIPESVVEIGESAFKKCPNIQKVISLANTPPILGKNALWSNDHDVALYVPEESIDLYKEAERWKEFNPIIPIPKQAKDTASTEFTVTQADSCILLSWPAVNNADSYTIEVKDNEDNVVCALIFNAQGELQSIHYAVPARNGNKKAQTAEQTFEGWQYILNYLDLDKQYTFTLVVTDNEGGELYSKTINSMPTAIENTLVDKNCRSKLLRNGQILILRGDHTYTLTGQEVK